MIDRGKSYASRTKDKLALELEKRQFYFGGRAGPKRLPKVPAASKRRTTNTAPTPTDAPAAAEEEGQPEQEHSTDSEDEVDGANASFCHAPQVEHAGPSSGCFEEDAFEQGTLALRRNATRVL